MSRIGWKRILLAVVFTLAGAALIGWGWVREGTTVYLPSFLLEIGAALLLFAPLALLGSVLAGRISRAEARSEEIDERVADVEEEVARAGTRIDDLDAQFAARLESTRAASRERAESVRQDVSFANVDGLLAEAESRSATSGHGTRVALASGERIRFQRVIQEVSAGTSIPSIWIHLEASDGSRPGVSSMWTEAESFETVWERLAQQAQAKNCYPGDATFAPEATVARLVATVQTAMAARDNPRGATDLDPSSSSFPRTGCSETTASSTSRRTSPRLSDPREEAYGRRVSRRTHAR